MSSPKRDKFSAARLRSLLEAEIADPLAGAYCVAFSGGADSTALLAALAELRAGLSRPAVRAVHVDHGLDEASGHWASAALQVCAALAVPCTVETARLKRVAGESVEAAAREARYAVLSCALRPGEVLLTAHHLDDQFETVLLQLARGAGVAGLAAMPASVPFAAGRHVRPLLGVSHAALVCYVRELGLSWIDDPMNDDLRFDRGFLRATVLPALRKRWPAIAANVARSASHMAEAQALLDSTAERDWARARDGARLDLSGLQGVDRARAANLLRYWIRLCGRPLPSARNLDQLLSLMTRAASDSAPRIRWPGADVRRYRNRLYLAETHDSVALEAGQWPWQMQGSLDLGEGLGSLAIRDGPGAALICRDRLPPVLRVTAGAGGEELRPHVGARQRSLRNLFQESGVVPWRRGTIPYVYAGSELVAVGDLWTDARYQPAADEAAAHLAWSGRPELF